MKRAGAYRVALAIGELVAIVFGSVAGAAEPIPLRAGPVTMLFDADNAFLRYVKVGEHEVLRGVNAPTRDHNWGTVRPDVANVQVENGGDHFRVTFDATCRAADIDFRWRGTITGSQNGEVEFAFDGEAHSTFLRNRIGLCILHGPSAAGKPWIVHHVNGQESKGRFPTHISPHQPAKELRAISHLVADKIWAHVEMQGDVFEMEDQRNWTDASFKTYCTPLELPIPVRVEKGTNISHKVRIRVEGDLPAAKTHESRPVETPVVLALGERKGKLPRIGLQTSSEAIELSQHQVEQLKELRLDHLRVDLQLSTDGWAATLREAGRRSQALGIPLHVGIRFGEQPQTAMQALVGELKAQPPNVALFLIHVSAWRQFQSAREALQGVRPKARIGAARGDNFVDLNRDRPGEDGLDVIAYGINPQIHAFDDMSIVETLPMHAETVRSTRQFIGDRSLAIGPITLRPPLVLPPKGSPDSPADVGPADVDVRQASPFVAAWTLGSLAYLAEVRAESVTYYETVGWKGVIDLDRGAKRPAGFPAPTGKAFPVYQVFREVADFAGADVQSFESSDPLAAVAMALKRAGNMRVLAANLTRQSRAIVLKGLGTPKSVSVLLGDAAQGKPTWQQGADDFDVADLRISLPPRAVVRVEFENRK